MKKRALYCLSILLNICSIIYYTYYYNWSILDTIVISIVRFSYHINRVFGRRCIFFSNASIFIGFVYKFNFNNHINPSSIIPSLFSITIMVLDHYIGKYFPLTPMIMMENYFHDEENEDCSICLESKCNFITHCNHKYHSNCLSEWLVRQTFCPLCKEDLPNYSKGYDYGEGLFTISSKNIFLWVG
jgi:hypothetical protein